MGENRVELLAPAGSPEAFYGAINAGADAVYLGGTRFGARAYAENFNEPELVGCIRYAHILGRKVYLTVNTLVKEKEFGELYDYLLPLYEAGLDGVIVQDLGVLMGIKERFPGLELHASTQMNITGLYSAGFLKSLGVCRVVPARELCLEEIRALKTSGLEVETFIHGAMCYCYSGQCLFSSILGGRSGNRGRCAQPCRLPYRMITKGHTSQEGYPLSLKDMCTLEYMKALIEAGIDSFKIEGRMKKPEYAAGVTAVYRKYIDRYYENPNAFRVEQEDLDSLSKLYIRSEQQSGYLFRHNGADMLTLSSPAYNTTEEELLCTIQKQYLENRLKLPVCIHANFTQGEKARIDMALIESPATFAGATALKQKILPHTVTVYGETVQPAQSRPVTRENLEKQLHKLGETAFYAEEMTINLSDNAFYPLKAVNELRRQAVAALETAVIELQGLCPERIGMPCSAAGMVCRDEGRSKIISGKQQLTNVKRLTLSVRAPGQLDALQEFCAETGHQLRRVYIDCDCILENHIDLNAFHMPVFLALPYVLRDIDKVYLKHLKELLSSPSVAGCMVRSLEGYAYLMENGYDGPVTVDACLYIWNREALRFWQNRAESFCLPLELNAGEQSQLTAQGTYSLTPEKLIYGRIPMMITAGCIEKTAGYCQKVRRVQNGSQDQHDHVVSRKTYEDLALQDRRRVRFPVVRNCTHCMNIIYNSVPLSLHEKAGHWDAKAVPRLDFTIEDAKQTLDVLKYFHQCLKDGQEAGGPPYTEYTTGHEKRGVE